LREVMNHHPCFNCTLPDCDEESKGCELKRAMNRYRKCLRDRTPVPDEVRLSRNLAYNELYADEVNKRWRAKKAEHHQQG